MNPIYLDHAAATPLDPSVRKALQPYCTKIYANPSSIHEAGQRAKTALEDARVRVAAILRASPAEIIFTSGGTESINLALKGIAFHQGQGHIITSSIEHPAVLETCRYLETKGFSVTYLSVDRYGLISLSELEKAIRKNTIFISIMYANNEIGTIQPLAEISSIAKKNKIPFHTDACQAGNLNIEVTSLGVDLLTLNGPKIYGPAGIGILYKKSSVLLEPLLHGGGQEWGWRSGTENVSGIIGFATALELIQKNKSKENNRQAALRDYFIQKILDTIPETVLNGHPTQRVPNNINIAFKGVEAEALVHYLSQKGIYISMGSACTSTEIKLSPVLKAIQVPSKYAIGSIRITLGKETTKKELDVVAKELRKIIETIRKVR